MRISDWSSDVFSSDLRKRRLLFLIEELEQLPVPHEMWAQKLGDETFVTIVRPYVLHHLVGIARSSDIREPHPVLGCRVHADAADVLHDAKAKRIRIETAIDRKSVVEGKEV